MAAVFGNDRREMLSSDVRLAPRSERRRTARALGAARATPSFPRLAGSGLEPLEARLLMSAVRNVAGFTTGNVGVGDDRSTVSAQSLGFATPVNFFGTQYNTLFVNNNGNVSFGLRNSTFVDAGINAIAAKMIAPFYADVDTVAGGSTVRYGKGVVDGHNAFGVNWVDVDYHVGSPGHTNHNSFQLVLIDRSDLGAGSFDVEFNYDQIRWESGNTQSGTDNGLGGNSARVGFTAGNGAPGTVFEMTGSGNAGTFLDGNLSTGLTHGSFMSDVAGRYVYRFRDGTWADAPSDYNTAPYVSLPAGLVLGEGANGSTSLPENITGMFDDPDADTWTVTVDYGDNTGTQVLAASDAKTFVLQHTYAAATSYMVTVTVDDGRGGIGTAAMPVDVYDVTAPVLEVSAPGQVFEGGSVTLVASTANDPDLNDFYSFEWTGPGVESEDGKSFTLHPTDNGTYTVRAIAHDQSGNTSYVDVDVVVTNVAPTASGLSSNGPVNEGSASTVTLNGASDVSPADLAAGLTYSFDFDNDGVFEVSGASASAGHVYADAGTHVVHARVADKDGGVSEYSTSVVVVLVNQPPTATFCVPASSLAEGAAAQFSLSGASDSAADLAAGLTFGFDFNNDGVFEVSGASSSVSYAFGDNGTYPVRARVTDRHGAHSDYAATVVVTNVAPVSTLVAPASGNEGAALSFGFGPVTDVAADAAAGFAYAFDFDNDGVFEVSGSSPSVTHVFDDNGKYTVRARVTDKDGASSVYTKEVRVNNVSPHSKKFWDNNPIAEGGVVTVGFDAINDPSAADTAAGFTYKYDWNNDGVFDLTTTSPTATHAFNDNGVFVVRGRVVDKDGGFEDYTTECEYFNVAPTARLVAGAPAFEGAAVTVRMEGVVEPSSADLAAGLTYSFDLNNDGVYEVSGSSPTATRTFANEGSFTVRGRVTDKDGGTSEYTTVVQVANAAPTVSGFTTSAAVFGAAKQGSMVMASASFADAGVLDTHTAVIDWGDGTTSAATLNESGGRGTLSGSHVYATGGMYTPTLRVVDNAATPGVGTAAAKAIVSGVGLHNGVLEVVGTNGADKVTVEDNKGSIKIKTDLLSQDPSFATTSVKEVQVWLGAGNDKFDTKGVMTRPVYVNGSVYSMPAQSTVGSSPSSTRKGVRGRGRLFCDVPVAA